MGCCNGSQEQDGKPDELTCPHWSDCGMDAPAGCCALGKYGGRPSYGVCLKICKNNTETETTPFWDGKIPPLPLPGEMPTASLLDKMKGAAGLVKAELGIGKVDDATEAKRRALCVECDQYDFGRCLECGCYLHAKVKIESETCPIGRW